MKKMCITFLVLIFVPSLVLAADFVPTNKLDIAVNDYVQYDFDGNSVDIPVEVMGTPARAYLIVTTYGKAGDMPRIRNGRLGWHTINNIDTTVYHSAGDDLEKGQKYLTWSGLDNDGNAVPEDRYTYYVWAFDYFNETQPAIPFSYSRPFVHCATLLTPADENGVPYPKPILTTRVPWGDVTERRVWIKWLLGNDPYNTELMETCYISDEEGWCPRAAPRMAFDPEDYNYVFHFSDKAEGKDATQEAVYKEKLVPNGIAERDTDWGTDLRWTYEGYTQECGVDTDGTYLYSTWWLNSKEDANPLLLVYTLDGDKVEDIYMPEWSGADYVAEHEGVRMGFGPRSVHINKQNNNKAFLSTIWCMRMVTDPVRYLDSGDYDDLIVAINEEGDGYCDKGWSADNPFPDYCGSEDPPWNYSMHGTKEGFSLTSVERAGPISWALMCPDMTCVGYCTVAGETDEGTNSLLPIMTGSPYDGLYRDQRGKEYSEEDAGIKGWYLGADVGRGIIAKSDPGTSVAAAPAAFTVAQNSPNPANPSTTISFTIPEAGNISVDIFNVAGQKVDTLVNEFMDAGSHSVVWDGSSMASGVYFYTVKSNEFSKTMKMTLLK